jgi:glycine betaine/choline ABC-type transport system substrate-binding protein
MRGAVLREHPELRVSLDALGGKISEEEMRRMNYAVDGERRDQSAVVQDFRSAHSL